MQQTIMRSEAMKVINSGQPFELEFVTADRRRGTGGDLVAVKNWLKVSKDSHDERIPGRSIPRKTSKRKDPAHHLNKTFNIFNPGNRVPPTKVHFRLIISLNGKTVING